MWITLFFESKTIDRNAKMLYIYSMFIGLYWVKYNSTLTITYASARETDGKSEIESEA